MRLEAGIFQKACYERAIERARACYECAVAFGRAYARVHMHQHAYISCQSDRTGDS